MSEVPLVLLQGCGASPAATRPTSTQGVTPRSSREVVAAGRPFVHQTQKVLHVLRRARGLIACAVSAVVLLCVLVRVRSLAGAR